MNIKYLKISDVYSCFKSDHSLHSKYFKYIYIRYLRAARRVVTPECTPQNDGFWERKISGGQSGERGLILTNGNNPLALGRIKFLNFSKSEK